MQLSPDQFASLKRVLSDPAAKVAVALGCSSATIEAVLQKMEYVARKFATTLGNARLLFIYSMGKKSGKKLDSAAVASFLRKNNSIVTVGDDGTWLSANSGTVSIVTATEKSERESTLCVICAAGQLCLFVGGKAIAEIGAAPPPHHGRSDWMRSCTELRQCFDDHFREYVESEKGLRYWSDRKKRVLLAGPDGTEKLFHHSLFWWCRSFISDAIDVFGETQALGQDKTDITIITEVGSIVVEVKWLGKNERGTAYVEVRIHEGVLQVADYLTRNPRLMLGYLVLYDGRSEADNRNACSYPASDRHDKCEEPVIYFLRSETPSEMATRRAAESRRGGKDAIRKGEAHS